MLCLVEDDGRRELMRGSYLGMYASRVRMCDDVIARYSAVLHKQTYISNRTNTSFKNAQKRSCKNRNHEKKNTVDRDRFLVLAPVLVPVLFLLFGRGGGTVGTVIAR